MKTFLTALVAILLIVSPAQAFLYDLEILTTDQIKALSDEKLVDTYTEAKIEDKASGEFIKAAGFSSAKEYDKRKQLLRFIIDLRREMIKRSIEPEPIEDWLQ